MKKNFLVVLFVSFLFAVLSVTLCSCESKNNASNQEPIRQIEIKMYVDGAYTSSLYTSSASDYKLTLPERPEDVSTNPNSDRYFYGWFTDAYFQTPVTEDTTFKSDGKIYAKWVTVFSNSFLYTVDYGVATITGFAEQAPTVLVVPDYINSFPVKRIAQDAFKDKTTIRTAIFCDGIATVGGFNGCTSLSEIKFPKQIDAIGRYAFANCGFSSFTIPQGVEIIGYGAFDNCKFLNEIKISNSVTTIGSYAFENCSNLTNITIPNSVKTIESHAFENCTKLSLLTLGENCSRIESSAFYGCPIEQLDFPKSLDTIELHAFTPVALNRITVEKGCEKYYAEGNCLIDKNGTVILGCRTSEIPKDKNITAIKEYAFENGFTKTDSFIVPDNILTIEAGAFKECRFYNFSCPFSDTSYTWMGTFLPCIFGTVWRENNNWYFGAGAYIKNTFTLTQASDKQVRTLHKDDIYGCSAKNVIIECALSNIEDYAFNSLYYVENISFSDGLTRISSGAMYGVAADKVIIKYKGTRAQWNAIAGSAYLARYKIVCSDDIDSE